jgi:hypothetical protein
MSRPTSHTPSPNTRLGPGRAEGFGRSVTVTVGASMMEWAGAVTVVAGPSTVTVAVGAPATVIVVTVVVTTGSASAVVVVSVLPTAPPMPNVTRQAAPPTVHLLT